MIGKDERERHVGRPVQHSRPEAEAMVGADYGAPRGLAQSASLMCLVFCVAALHGRTAGFGFTRTDDRVLLNDDAAFIQDLSSLSKIFWRPFFAASPRGETYFRPIVTGSFIVDAQWAGITPRAFHLTNVALHITGTCLL